MPARKVKLPPTTLEGIDTYFARRGYRKNPILAWSGGAYANYVKPLPDGRRMHVQVFQYARHFKVKTHIDHHDPGRDPVSHALIDGSVKRRNLVVKIPRRKKPRSLSEEVGKLLKQLLS